MSKQTRRSDKRNKKPASQETKKRREPIKMITDKESKEQKSDKVKKLSHEVMVAVRTLSKSSSFILFAVTR